MKIWESKDKNAYLQMAFGSQDFDTEAAVSGTNNCGVGTLTGLSLYLYLNANGWGWQNLPLFRPAPQVYAPDYVKQYQQVYGKHPPCAALEWDSKVKAHNIPAFSKAELYKLITDKFVEFAKANARYGLYLLSNRVVDGSDTVFNQAQYPFQTRGTAWLMKVIRDTKCGTLITSPVVENISHPKASGIMVGMWVPPNSNVLHNKVGVSKGFDDSRLESINKQLPVLAAGTEKFVDYFYGRKTISSRLEGEDRDSAGVSVGAKAAR